MRRTRTRFGPAAIALTYTVLGAAWILGSDRVLLALFHGDPHLLVRIGTAKGWLYVLVSAALLYTLITVRERALARQDHLFSTAISVSPDPVLVCEQGGGVVAANAAADAVFGKVASVAEITGWFAEDGVTPLAAADHPLARALAGEALAELYLVRNARAPDGRWFSVAARPVKGRRVDGAVISCHDVTALRRAEEEVRTRECALRAMARLAPVAIVRADANGRAIWRNERWAELSGRPLEAGLGDEWAAAIHPDDRVRVLAAWREFVGTKGSFREEYRYVRPDGEVVWVYAQGEPDRDAEGRVVGFIGTLTDITERKRVEDEALQLNARLEQRVRERTAELEASARELAAFSSSVSHDLRAPLRTISGFASLILQDHGAELSESVKAYLGRVVDSAVRMGGIIDSLLGLARVTQTEIRRSAVDLHALVAAIAEELRAAEPNRRVELRVTGDREVHADPTLLRIALENLLSNAWKFTANRAVGHVAVEVASRDGEAVVCVRDDGAGFDMAWADRLFRPFERLHTLAEFPGSGVGLATVARIVARHGGRTWAEGAVGGGAAFWFTLPDAVAGTAEAPPPSPSTSPQPES